MSKRLCFKTQLKDEKFWDFIKCDIYAYDYVFEWSDFTNYIPDLEENKWNRTVEIPKVGSTMIVKATNPFDFYIGDKLWTLFQPALSYLNGWEDVMNEIDESAMVKCLFESVIVRNTKSAWIKVKILDLVELKDIPDRFTLKKDCNSLNEFWIYDDISRYEYNNWFLFNVNQQGNWGIWALIKKTTDFYIRVLFGEWLMSSRDFIYIGNVVVDDNDFDRIIRISKIYY